MTSIESKPDPWTALEATVRDGQRWGHKALRLSDLAAAGLPTASGWILDTSAVAALEAPSAARHLRALHPTPRWLIRSSSPLEDRSGASAAGLFESEIAVATDESLAAALLRVAHPRRGVAEAIGVQSDALEIAILAQPLLELSAWATIEIRDAGSEDRLEGWRLDTSGAPHAWHDPAPDWIVLARRAASVTGILPALLEMGEDSNGLHILQIRPAPTRALPRAPEAIGAPAVTPLLDLSDWVWDAEHSPFPMCPLLAGIFSQWTLEGAEEPKSRVIAGRWYDRRHDEFESSLDLDEVDALLREWAGHGTQRVESALAVATVAANALDGRVETWVAFVSAWLELQRTYFDGPSGRLRGWARTTWRNVARTLGDDRWPLLPRTIVAKRDARWNDLAKRLGAAGLAPSAEAIELHVSEDPESGLAIALAHERGLCAHLCDFPFDGRGIPWEEDPRPLYREVARRAARRAPRDPGRPAGWPSEHRELERRVAQILVDAEDDDDRLLRGYSIWRSALRSIAKTTAVDVDTLLDLQPEDFEMWLASRDRDAMARGRSRGRALFAAWSAALPGRDTEPLRGRCAAGGRARGPLRRGESLAEVVGASEDVVAVVPTLLPSDGIWVPFCRAILCEAGGELGHATVLCREHDVPCVVGIPAARLRLSDASEVLVDADRGEVLILASNSDRHPRSCR